MDNAKGTRDFGPKEKILRDYIIDILKEVCENYGFNPILTIERILLLVVGTGLLYTIFGS